MQDPNIALLRVNINKRDAYLRIRWSSFRHDQNRSIIPILAVSHLFVMNGTPTVIFLPPVLNSLKRHGTEVLTVIIEAINIVETQSITNLCLYTSSNCLGLSFTAVTRLVHTS